MVCQTANIARLQRETKNEQIATDRGSWFMSGGGGGKEGGGRGRKTCVRFQHCMRLVKRKALVFLANYNAQFCQQTKTRNTFDTPLWISLCQWETKPLMIDEGTHHKEQSWTFACPILLLLRMLRALLVPSCSACCSVLAWQREDHATNRPMMLFVLPW